MKKLITILAGVVLTGVLVTGACAQAAGPAGGGVQTGAAQTGAQKPGKGAHAPIPVKLLKELNLTPDQQKQVKELIAKFRQQQEQEQKGATGTLVGKAGKANRKEAGARRKEFLEDLAKILTPEQKEKLKQLMEQARNKKGGKVGGTPPPATGGTTKSGGGI